MNQHPSMDQLLLDRLNEVIDNNLQNEQFSVTELANESGLSKSQLNRRLQTITNQSASQFIREYRLKRAMELLQSKAATPTEVAYKVGFGSPSYFSTCFKEFYGYSPGEVSFRKVHENTPKYNSSKRFVWIPAIVLIFIALSYVSYQFLSKTSIRQPGSRSEAEKSIAIVPFKTITKDSSSLDIAEGVREAILNNLQIIGELLILPSSSTEKYRDTDKASLEIAKELGVNYIVEGSAQKYGNEFRITIRLIDGLKGHQIWSNSYDHAWGNIFKTYSEISISVATNMQTIISPEERQRIDKTLNTNPVAYELMLKARYEKQLHAITRNKNHFNNSINLLDSAIKIDPNYADAFAEKSTYYFHAGNLDSMVFYFEKALEIDPNNPKANDRKARFYQIFDNPDIAIKHFVKALEYSPNSINTNIFLGQVYCQQKNDIRRGYPYLMKAMDLIGEKSISLSDIAGTLYGLGEYKKATMYYKR